MGILRSRITLLLIILLVQGGMIYQGGWILPIVGFIILLAAGILIYYNDEIQIWKQGSLWKYSYIAIICLAIPVKITDIKTRLSDKYTIVFESEESWDEKGAVGDLTDEVFNQCKNYPNLKELNVVIIDACKDYKGNIRKDTTKIVLHEKELTEYRTYADSYSFKSCPDFSYKMFTWIHNRCNGK